MAGATRKRGVLRGSPGGRPASAVNRKVIRSNINRVDGSKVYTRPPRGSKKTTVGKSKRKYRQHGSYSTHGRR